jgi:hypothetical protein
MVPMSQLELLIKGNQPNDDLYDQRSNVSVATDSGSILTTQHVLKQEFLPTTTLRLLLKSTSPNQ